VGIGSILHKKPHQIEGLFMVYENGGEIERRLPCLCFQPIHDNGVVFTDEALDGLDGAAYQQVY
jgi:hypothetical protein